ncbi:MAG: ISNCY family transposase [Planctomycetes bacterium]|nr:ISNCY family transposase [Planctomycetota bacterium]
MFDAQYKSMAWAISPKNPMMKELAAIDKLLDEASEILDLVHADLTKAPRKTPGGRPTEVSCEQVLRSAILMQLRGLHYRQLAEEIDANLLYRKFTRFYGKKVPHFTTLNDLIKMISPETMEEVNEAIVRLGIKKKVENGKSIRHDTTVTETDIAHPVDARLLSDSVRVMDRLLRALREAAAARFSFPYHNHKRAVKKRAYQIVMAKGKNIEKKRKGWYEKLLGYQEKVRRYAEGALEAMGGDAGSSLCSIQTMGIAVELENALALAERVYNQAYRRVILGERVPAEEKIVSIFETHTDIICRGKKGSKTEFGHKFDVATGRSGLITFYKVYKGNPCDGDVLADSLKHHEHLFGRVPERMTGDRRYHSKAGEEIVAAAGVAQVAFPKPGRLSEIRKSLQKAPWFRRLMRWRAGIEGNLSTLLRSFGLKRCLWHGWRSFKAYVGLGVLTYNLRLLAGHLGGA